jgi:uncharacterized protein YbjT (DUF2867 family)
MGYSTDRKSDQKNSRRHIMVTGGAGYLGRVVARELVQRGESIIGLYHQKLPEALDRMMPLCADLRSPESILAPLRSVESVIHLAWEGGVLGSSVLRGQSANREKIQSSGNVAMTENLVRAMERQQVKRIVFLSWMGAADGAERLVQKEKYWAENVILNSNIPEKIIVRCGLVIDPEEKSSEFALATQRLNSFPLFTPLPRNPLDIVLTSKTQLVTRLVDLITRANVDGENILQEVTSAGPLTSAEAISTCVQKWWGQRKIPLGGLVGRQIFSLLDSEFGRIAADKARMSDYLAVSRAEGMLTGVPVANTVGLPLAGA